MNDKKLVLLCARTARSSAYLQALLNAGIRPDAVVLYGSEASSFQTKRDISLQTTGEMFCPDLSVDLDDWLSDQAWPVHICADRELNAPLLQSLLARLEPDLLVYSGYGGQLVPLALLQLAPLLHIHSGWLPDFRGSTTLYYHILEDGDCAASALLLDESIDTGPVLVRRRYPKPPAGMDVDYLYDNMIRADLLVITLQKWLLDQPLEPDPSVSDEQSQAYYIIHPLLKHLAIQAIDKVD